MNHYSEIPACRVQPGYRIKAGDMRKFQTVQAIAYDDVDARIFILNPEGDYNNETTIEVAPDKSVTAQYEIIKDKNYKEDWRSYILWR